MPPQFLRDSKPLTIQAVKVLRYFILVTDTFWVLRIGQTEKIYYILPDPNANSENKLVKKQTFIKCITLLQYLPILNGILRDRF